MHGAYAVAKYISIVNVFENLNRLTEKMAKQNSFLSSNTVSF